MKVLHEFVYDKWIKSNDVTLLKWNSIETFPYYFCSYRTQSFSISIVIRLCYKVDRNIRDSLVCMVSLLLEINWDKNDSHHQVLRRIQNSYIDYRALLLHLDCKKSNHLSNSRSLYVNDNQSRLSKLLLFPPEPANRTSASIINGSVCVCNFENWKIWSNLASPG